MPRDRKPSRPFDRPQATLHSVRLLPRRFLLALGLACLVLFVLILSLPSSTSPTLDQIRDSYQHSAKHAKQFFRDHQNLPCLYNPFATGDDAQRPADQKGARRGDIRWFNDVKWQKPFSNAVTLDDERVVLPPSLQRTPIYTYYDSGDRPQDVVEAEQALLQSWRRAWWAHGFKPEVLDRADAKKEHLYRRLQEVHTEASAKSELERWLAWSHAGGGILCNYLAFPMTSRSDAFLIYLQNTTFSHLTRFKTLGNGLYVGGKEDVDSALASALSDPDKLTTAKSTIDTLSFETLQVSSRDSTSIAYYDLPTLATDYKAVADDLSSSKRDGINSLRNLVDAHLHLTWQSTYPKGIQVVKPYPEHMTTLTSSAIRIAQLLSICPSSNPLPASCPPNNKNCKPCTTLPLSLSESIANTTEAFRVVTVPHPLTFTSLSTFLEPHKLTVPFTRRKTTRDAWVTAVTHSITSEGLGAQQRLPSLKEAVMSQHALWLTAERVDDPLDLSWRFGFDITGDEKTEGAETPARVQAKLHEEQPPVALSKQHKQSKVKGKKKEQQPVVNDEDSDVDDSDILDEREQALKNVGRQDIRLVPTDINLSRERSLMQAATGIIVPNGIVGSKGAREARLREMLESWNLADTEAWRFVRAMNARRVAEREGWEKEGKGMLDLLL